MKTKLPTFIELYLQLIAITSISSVDVNRDQSNKTLINLLAEWLTTLGGKINIQPVPDTRHKFNLLYFWSRRRQITALWAYRYPSF